MSPDSLPSRRSPWAWATLAALSAVLILGAVTYDRSSWPSFMGDEATYLMQAESLAWDQDLLYSGTDYRRFRDRWQLKPQGLILQSGDEGERIVYGKPFFYALYLAPFVRLAPLTGPFVANALLLAFTAFFVARVLERRIGSVAPLWVATLLFGSVTFAFVFWAHADLFMLCLTALALALAFDPARSGALTVGRWMLVGALLAMVAYSRPIYAPLFLPALLALPRPRLKVSALTGLVVAALAVTLATASVHRALVGSWTSYGATRSGFYNHTGYPDIDFPRDQWLERVKEQGNSAVLAPGRMLRAKKMTPSLLSWNSAYFLVGRHVGLLPYFLPVLLAFLGPLVAGSHAVVERASAGRASAGRASRWASWGLVAAVVLSVLAFLWTRPFNFYGGGGTIANRYFLPLYPALWFLSTRRLRLVPVLAAALLSGLFLGGLWLHPRSFPVTQEGTYGYVTPAAQRLLPFETTQSHLKLAGREDLYGNFFVRYVSPELRSGRDGYIRLGGEQRGELLLASTKPLTAVDLAVRAPARVEVEVDGGRAERLVDDELVQRIRLHLDRTLVRHPMWWTWEQAHLYSLRLRFVGVEERPVAFTLTLPTL